MTIALLSFVAGLLTAFAPCVLPLLPVILGGSLAPGSKRDTKRPYIITGSLVISLTLFTILLKVSSVLISVDPRIWSIGAGTLVIALGVFMLLPDLWARLIATIGFERWSLGMLSGANKQKNSIVSAILIGAALGPVFSSCSPTYAWVLATVLPANTTTGIIYLAIYCIGVATALLAVALLGRRLLQKARWATNPTGWFQRGIAILFILVGIFVATGWDKNVQVWLVDKDFLHLISLEQNLIPGSNKPAVSSGTTKDGKMIYNVDPYQAPELTSIDSWLNSTPLTLKELRGKVVLIDFWTYSCINCIRTQPYLNAWYDKYHDNNLVIIGVHAPEFAFERVPANVQQAVKDEHIKYPVALDNSFATWRAYDNHYWPAKYLIDKDGMVRYTHFGEGSYDETERIIQALIKETGTTVQVPIADNLSTMEAAAGQTPETYIGYERAERFSNSSQVKQNIPVRYSLSSLAPHEWSLGGTWQVNADSAVSKQNGATLAFNVVAGEVYLVMSGPAGAKVHVDVDGLAHPGGADVDGHGDVTLDGARLYKLVHADGAMQAKRMTLTFASDVSINAFTFGK